MARASFDVVIVGGGLAGISAALSARSGGASVALVCEGSLCAGSSFSRNTWGLGMIAEAHEPFIRGHQSLYKAMETIGMGLCTPGLPERLTADAEDSIEWLARAGAKLRIPEDATQREYVPCFDHEMRTWRGFLSHGSENPLRRTVRKAGISVFEHTQLVSLLKDDEQVFGVLTLHKISTPLFIDAHSVVLCCGGLAGLYGSHICPSTTGCGHLAALEAGASLVNIEFEQLMVGYLKPLHGVVFNEKLWRWVSLTRDDAVANALSPTKNDLDEALEAHSWHGPFTSERTSRLVEQFICEAPHGCAYTQVNSEALGPDRPGIIDDYLRWLSDEKHISAGQRLAVGLFAHSSNGGITIDENGFTGVRGLYAAGEMAGGVHGADRIGGLASVSAVVFGRRAGAAAAASAHDMRGNNNTTRVGFELRMLSSDAAERIKELRSLLDRHALVPRSQTGLDELRDRAQRCLDWIKSNSVAVGMDPEKLSPLDLSRVSDWRKAQSSATLTQALALAMLERTETRGSHMRSDYPMRDEQQTHQLQVSLLPDSQLSVRACHGDV